MAQINMNAAGIDIGAEEFYVAVGKDREAESVRTFPTFTADIHHLADWLSQCKIETALHLQPDKEINSSTLLS